MTHFSEPSEKLSIYVDSFYLITTTVSTVGYGDFKAYLGSDGVYTAEMVYLYFVTMFGITLFSSVTNEIFSYKRVRPIQEIVNRRVKDIELFLYDVSRRLKDKSLEDEQFLEVKEYIREATANSTQFHYHANEYYQLLPPNL